MKLNIPVFAIILSIEFVYGIKWIHEEGRKAEGDNVGPSLMAMQITNKAMIRPQTWFFDVMTQKPTVKYIKEAEENGLKYQIERLKDSLENKYVDILNDKASKKIEMTETKLENRLREASYKDAKPNVFLVNQNNVMTVDPQVLVIDEINGNILK